MNGANKVSELVVGDVVAQIGDFKFVRPQTVARIVEHDGSVVAIYWQGGGFCAVPQFNDGGWVAA